MSQARIGRVRFKSGGEIRSLHNHLTDKAAEDLRRSVQDIIASGRIAGWAVIAWDETYVATTDWHCGDLLSQALLPVFVERVFTAAMNNARTQNLVDELFRSE